MTRGKGSLGTSRPAENSTTASDGYAWSAARRLLGMEEADDKFITIVCLEPELKVEDFDEDKLGLMTLSFNLNPAMVARVSAWRRSSW